jgi:hypothetical protein
MGDNHNCARRKSGGTVWRLIAGGRGGGGRQHLGPNSLQIFHMSAGGGGEGIRGGTIDTLLIDRQSPSLLVFSLVREEMRQ